MTVWVALDTDFFRNRKARAAGRDGRDLYLAALCHAKEQLTDGHVTPEMLPVLAAEAGVRDAKTAVRLLVEVGMWHDAEGCDECPKPHPGGYVIHNFEERNRTREQVESRRQSWRDQKQSWRESKRDKRGESARVSDGVSAVDTQKTPPDVRGDVRAMSGSTEYRERDLTSQSSTNGCRGERFDDDDRTHRARKAAEVDLAAREAERGPVANRQAWLDEAARRRLESGDLETPEDESQPLGIWGEIWDAIQRGERPQFDARIEAAIAELGGWHQGLRMSTKGRERLGREFVAAWRSARGAA